MTIADKQLHGREIITKAVCGKGRKFSTVTHTVTPPHKPTSILGAWIINHQYEAVRCSEGIEVVGTYDINIWYSYSNNSQTDVAKESVQYVEVVPLSYLDGKHRPSTEEVYADVLQEPNCIEANISSNGDSVNVRVEREYSVELIAETKVCVAVWPHGISDMEDKGLSFNIDSDNDFEDLDSDLLEDDL